MERPDYYGNPAGLSDDVDVVRAVYAAFAARDLEAAFRHIDPDCELHLAPTASRVGRTEPYRGHDGLREYLADVSRTWDDLELHAEDFRSVPGAVVVLGHVLLRAQDAERSRAAVWTWRVRDGRAYSVRVADMGEL